MDDAQHLGAVGDGQRRAARVADAVGNLLQFGGDGASVGPHIVGDGVDRPLADGPSPEVETAHARLRGERDERTLGAGGHRDLQLLCHERHDRTTLGRLVGQAGELSRRRKRLKPHASERDQLVGHAVAVGDGARLVEQQRVHVARGLDGPATHGDDILLQQAIHAGDPDGRQKAADGGRDQAYQ